MSPVTSAILVMSELGAERPVSSWHGSKFGCPGACGQIKVDDELMHDADEVMVIADAAWVVRNAMDVSPLHNSFVETQEAMMMVFLIASGFPIHCQQHHNEPQSPLWTTGCVGMF